jgi:hypothetical protein
MPLQGFTLPRASRLQSCKRFVRQIILPAVIDRFGRWPAAVAGVGRLADGRSPSGLLTRTTSRGGDGGHRHATMTAARRGVSRHDRGYLRSSIRAGCGHRAGGSDRAAQCGAARGGNDRAVGSSAGSCEGVVARHDAVDAVPNPRSDGSAASRLAAFTGAAPHAPSARPQSPAAGSLRVVRPCALAMRARWDMFTSVGLPPDPHLSLCSRALRIRARRARADKRAQGD